MNTIWALTSVYFKIIRVRGTATLIQNHISKPTSVTHLSKTKIRQINWSPFIHMDIYTYLLRRNKLQFLLLLILTRTVQILCEQRHSFLLPQGIWGFLAEVNGPLCGITLQGEIFKLKSLHSHFFREHNAPHSVVSSVWICWLNVFFPLPEFPERPADAVRCSGPSPLLPPATCSSHTELTAWGSRCGAGKTLWTPRDIPSVCF